MSQWDNTDNDNGSTPNPNDGGGLRQFAETVQQENKKLKEEFAALRQELTQQKVQSVFDSAGVPGAAALYQGDADPEKAKAWIESVQSAFGASGTTVPTSQAPAAPALTPEDQQRFENLNNAGAAGTPLGTMESAIAGANDASDIESLIANFQNAARSTQ